MKAKASKVFRTKLDNLGLEVGINIIISILKVSIGWIQRLLLRV